MMTGTQLIAGACVPERDAAEFAQLPDEVKWEVLDLLEVFRTAAVAPRPRTALADAATRNRHKPGWSFKSLERKFYALRNTGDWRALVNAAKTTGGGKAEWITPAVIEAWRTYCDQHPRSMKSAYIELAANYKSGQMIGDVDWRRVWQALPELRSKPMPPKCPPGMPLPPGWSYWNMMRHKPKRIETVAARRGPHAARKFSARVHTTRENLLPGQQYEFDDMWHNCKVVCRGYPKAVRPLELACIDIASANKIAFALKPRMEDEDGKRRNITEADMRFLVAHVLTNIGYHKDGCLLLVEGGTAAIRDRLKKVLHELSDGKITVSTSGVDRQIPLGKWGYDTKGNPDHKAHIESWHNLAQNRLDALPGYTGSNARLDKPEDHEALCKVVGKMLAASCSLPPELAARLRFPVFDWDTFSDVVHEVYAQIAWSSDHTLEGWHNRTERQWRVHPADLWHSECEFLALPKDVQDRLAPLVAMPGNTQVVRQSRARVWEDGQRDLVRLPDWSITLICGDDLAQARPCPAMAEVVFVNQDIESGRPQTYRLSTCIGPAGERVQLKEGEMYLWTINPFDPRHIFITDTWGRYVGRCNRVAVVDRADLDAVGREIGIARRELSEAIAPVARRGAKRAREMIADMRTNAALLREGGQAEAARIEAERAVSAERRAATRGVTLDDLCAGGEEQDDDALSVADTTDLL
jgi:hypothetical protein